MATEYTYRFLYKATQKSRNELGHIKRNHLSSFILVVLYGVGILSLIFNLHPDFIYLTPINLLLSFLIIMYSHKKWDYKIFVVLLISFLFGMGMEIIGVTTGAIFGEYQYGDVLGPKFMGTPYTIGLNWMMLVYCAGATVNYITIERTSIFFNIFVKSFLGALLLLSLDVLMEPVAINYGFWSWGGDGHIPMDNYIAWFLISFFLLIIFNLLLKNLKNKVAFTLLLLQFLFFFLLGIDWF